MGAAILNALREHFVHNKENKDVLSSLILHIRPPHLNNECGKKIHSLLTLSCSIPKIMMTHWATSIFERVRHMKSPQHQSLMICLEYTIIQMRYIIFFFRVEIAPFPRICPLNAPSGHLEQIPPPRSFLDVKAIVARRDVIGVAP